MRWRIIVWLSVCTLSSVSPNGRMALVNQRLRPNGVSLARAVKRISVRYFAGRAAGASSPSIQRVAYAARRGERHTLCHRSERHAARLDQDRVFRFQALFRAYRSISTIAHLKPIALHVSRPLRSRYPPLARDHSRRGSFHHDMTCRSELSGPPRWFADNRREMRLLYLALGPHRRARAARDRA